MEKNIIFLGGINGSGKSTVAGEVSKRTGLPFFEGSKELMRELELQEEDYIELRKMSEKKKKEAFERVFRRISEMSADKKAIITGHFVKVLNGEITKFSGPWFNFCSDLFHITSEPRVILDRIKKDEMSGTKHRAVEGDAENPEKFITEAQIESLKCLQEAVQQYCSVAHVVDNNKDLSKTISEICGKIKHKVQ